jgi:aspartyl-tRNA synthetase
MMRSHTCGELTAKNAGNAVQLCGWVDRHRDIGQLYFLTLRDRYGMTQCVYETQSTDKVMETLKSLRLEDCVRVHGKVRKRTDKDVNREMATGEIEIVVDKVDIPNRSEVLPFQVKDDVSAADDLRLKYRYLDLRRPKMQRNLQIRHQIIQSARTVFHELGFLEIETPLLIRSTPEGARDFVVPSRLHPGKFYALPQSPQLYKQMLMISGCDRYFQFAPAFRDEDLRADRVPVHTQIDMEMTFVEEQDVFKVVEAYLTKVFADVRGLKIQTPFPIMPYAEAMERYGIDKPDVRFGLELKTITDFAKKSGAAMLKDAACVRAFSVPNADAIARKDIDAWTEVAKRYGAKGLGWLRWKDGALSGSLAKFFEPAAVVDCLGMQEGSVAFIVADSYKVCCDSLAQVRLATGRKLDLIDRTKHAFLWVNQFPLFEWDEKENQFMAMHHLFTHPMDEDMQYLDSDPGKVRGKLYDLVLNGVELISGSIRINRPELQQKVLDIVKMSREEADSKFGFLMESFKYGAPPHGGCALGLDRLTAILCEVDSIREVIAYPCNNTGVFPLDGSPAPINEIQKKELKLKVLWDEQSSS